MASKNLMSVNPVTQVNDSDMFYTVQGSTTDGRVSAIQISEFVKLGLTKADVGLANVNNTSDLDKPISAATQAALDDKQDELVSGVNIKTINGQSVLGAGDLEVGGAVDSVNGQTGVVVLDSDDVGAISQALLAVPGGVATLDSTGKLEPSQVPNLATARKITVADVSARLSLASYPDLTIAYQSDTGEAWGLNANADPSVASNWSSLGGVPTSGVVTFNSRTGIVSPQVGDYNADMITETTRKFVSELEKSVWNSKQEALVSGVNIKTINGQSVVGSGNLTINTGAVDSVNGKTGTVVLSKADVGLSNVDNTSDVNKPISTATQLALDEKQDELISGTTIKTVNGETILGSGDLVVTGAVDSVNGRTGAVVLTKTDIGLSNVDNTSDLDKPVSTATQLVLDDKQDVLQSGVNIKTVNGQSILGSGNVEISGGGSSEIIRTPVAVAPLTGTLEFPVDGTLQASPYAPLYSADAREFREFQIDIAAGDFTSPVAAAQVNADAWGISPAIPDNTDLQWRCRDKSVKGDYSEWSEPQTFKTYDIYVVTPVILTPTEGGELPERDQPITASAFQMVNSGDAHAASYWTIKDKLGVVAYQTGRDTGNLTSWQPPLGVIEVGEAMSVEVRYESAGGFVSEVGVRGFVGAAAPYGKYLAVGHANSPYLSLYGQDADTFTKLSNPSILPTGELRGVAFDRFSEYGVAGFNTTPFVRFYKRAGDTFTSMTLPTAIPNGVVQNCTVSGSGIYAAVVGEQSPYLNIYKRTDQAWQKLPNPAVLPTTTSLACGFSPDENYLVVNSAQTLIIYKRNGDTFDQIAGAVNTQPTGQVRGVSFSNDGNYLFVASEASPFIFIYKRSGDNFTKLANPSTLPTHAAFGVAVSPGSQYFATFHFNSPYVRLYKQTSPEVFAQISNVSPTPPAFAKRGSFSVDGNYLAIAHNSSPYVSIYKRSGDTFSKLPNPSILPSGDGSNVWMMPEAIYSNL